MCEWNEWNEWKVRVECMSLFGDNISIVELDLFHIQLPLVGSDIKTY